MAAVVLIGSAAEKIGGGAGDVRFAGAAGRRHGDGRALAGRRGAERRLCCCPRPLQPRHVRQLCGAGGRFVAAVRVCHHDAQRPRRAPPLPFEIDYLSLWSVLLLLFAGMVMYSSASIMIVEAGA